MKTRLFLLAAVALFAGCATPEPIFTTKVIKEPVPVYCKIERPKECRADYAVDRLADQPDDVSINRALRAEIEERAACEAKLEAALKGCNEKGSGK